MFMMVFVLSVVMVAVAVGHGFGGCGLYGRCDGGWGGLDGGNEGGFVV